MCGIAGLVRTDGGDVDPRVLERMADVLVHRGPDGAGVWCRGPVGLAHRRLSIIDLDGSHQPMVDERRGLALALNGEVLNYRELRSALHYPFRTSGDTEVVLAAYAREGPRSVQRLRGQFAHAVYDEHERAVRLFRDRLGILPLFWCRTAGAVVFASEMKAVLAALPAVPPVDEDSLDDYLTHRAVRAPHTLFRGISKLRPGHWLDVRLDGRVEEHCYWRLEDVVDEGSVPLADALRRTEEALTEAVQANLVADVPVGAYLSGGLDSSVIAAMASKASDGPLHTFCAGFGDPSTDETPWARRVSRHLGTEHHEVVVRPRDFVGDWHALTWHRDAPLSEPADVAVFHLARLARGWVKVVLSGEGSDELFGGYPKHRFAAAGPALDRLPGGVRRLLGSVDPVLPAGARRARTALRALTADGEGARLEEWFAPFSAAERGALLGRPRAGPSRPDPARLLRSPLNRQLAHDLVGWLPDNLLERADRMSMAASLEVRPPFLDHHLVELAFGLPARAKVRVGTGKWVVRQLGRELLPRDVVDRPKNGFRVPLAAWFRSELRELVHDSLTGPGTFVGTTLEPAAVRRLLDSHDSGRRDEHMRIWTLLCLEMWHDVFYKSGSGAVGACVRAGGAVSATDGAPSAVA